MLGGIYGHTVDDISLLCAGIVDVCARRARRIDVTVLSREDAEDLWHFRRAILCLLLDGRELRRTK